MVEDSTVARQYFRTRYKPTFRGLAQTNATGFLAFNGEGVGDTGVVTGINFDGTATMIEDGSSALSIRLEGGTTSDPTFGTKLIANGSGKSATVNGALTTATTAVLDGNSGTIAVGDVVTVKDTNIILQTQTEIQQFQQTMN